MPRHLLRVEPKGYKEFEDLDTAPSVCHHQMAGELLIRLLTKIPGSKQSLSITVQTAFRLKFI